MGGAVVIGGGNLLPVGIGLTDLPNIRGDSAVAPLAPPVPASLSFGKIKKNANITEHIFNL